MTFRVRTKDSRSTLTGTWYAEQYVKAACSDPNPSWSVFYNSAKSQATGEYRSMSDVTTPGFVKRRQNGDIVMNPLSQRSLTLDAGTGFSFGEVQDQSLTCTAPNSYYMRWKYYATGNVSSGRVNSGFGYNIGPDLQLVQPAGLISGSDMDALLQEASTRCMSERGRGTDSNPFEDLAEIHKTFGLLESYLGNAKDILFKNKKLLTRAKALGSAYLATRYGLLPVMSDIQSVCNGLKKKVDRIRITSRSKVTYSTTVDTALPDLQFFGAWYLNRKYHKTDTYTVRAMSVDEVDADRAFNTGFTSKNFLTTPWELVPYSFVVDWFVNVGDFIGAIVPSFGLQQLGSCLVVERKLDVDYIETGYYLLSPSTRTVITPPDLGTCSYRYHEKTRTPGLTNPGVVVKADFRFSHATRCLDALALIVQRLTGKPYTGKRSLR